MERLHNQRLGFDVVFVPEEAIDILIEIHAKFVAALCAVLEGGDYFFGDFDVAGALEYRAEYRLVVDAELLPVILGVFEVVVVCFLRFCELVLGEEGAHVEVLVAVVARRKFVFLDVQIESFSLLLVEVADGAVYHLCDARVFIDVNTNVAQLAKSCHDVLCNPCAFHHSCKPGPCTAWQLSVGKFGDELLVFCGDTVGVEELNEIVHTVGLVVAVYSPRGFVDENGFEFLIFEQRRGEHLTVLSQPIGEYCGDFGIVVEDELRHRIGKELGECLLVAVVRILRQPRQAAHGVPCGVAGIFEREAVVYCRCRGVVGPILKFKRACLVATDGERHCLGNKSLVGEDGDDVLLAVAVYAAHAHDADYDRLFVLRHVNHKFRSLGLALEHFKRLQRLPNLELLERAHCLHVEHFHLYLSAHNVVFAEVGEFDGDFHLVAAAHEAGQIGDDAEILVGNKFVGQCANSHIFGVGDAEHFPTGDALWHCKFYEQVAVVICNNIRLEECSLGEIGADFGVGEVFAAVLPCHWY